MARVVVYPGSFDPLTVGHLDIIQRGARIFDRLVVAVGNNPAKRYCFDLEERLHLLRESCAEIPGVEVGAFSGLLVDYCTQVGADAILRGLRAFGDFDLEFRNGLANRDLSGIETVFLLSEPNNVFVSSSLVREIAQFGGDVSRYVPEPVKRAIMKRWQLNK